VGEGGKDPPLNQMKINRRICANEEALENRTSAQKRGDYFWGNHPKTKKPPKGGGAAQQIWDKRKVFPRGGVPTQLVKGIIPILFCIEKKWVRIGLGCRKKRNRKGACIKPKGDGGVSSKNENLRGMLTITSRDVGRPKKGKKS